MEEKACHQPAKPLTCGPENVADFNARLRTDLPGLFDLAKALHQRGMIDGLRGARIGPAGSLGQRGVVPALSNAAEKRLRDREAQQGRGKR